MAELTVTHEFACDEDTWWGKCFLDHDFNHRLYVERLRFPQWQIIEEKRTGDLLTRRVEIAPVVDNLPAPLRKILGDRFTYAEEGTFDLRTKRYTFRVVPSALADKLIVRGEIHCEAIGEKRTRRVAKMHVEARIFAIGGMLEERTLSDTKRAYDKAAEFTSKYLAEAS